jgi:hypothetical protein
MEFTPGRNATRAATLCPLYAGDVTPDRPAKFRVAFDELKFRRSRRYGIRNTGTRLRDARRKMKRTICRLSRERSELLKREESATLSRDQLGIFMPVGRVAFTGALIDS